MQASEIAFSQNFTQQYRVCILVCDVEIQRSGQCTEGSLSSETLKKQVVGRFKNHVLPSVQTCKDWISYHTYSFWVTFSGSTFPHYIELEKLRLTVRLFGPRVMICQTVCRWVLRPSIVVIRHAALVGRNMWPIPVLTTHWKVFSAEGLLMLCRRAQRTNNVGENWNDL